MSDGRLASESRGCLNTEFVHPHKNTSIPCILMDFFGCCFHQNEFWNLKNLEEVVQWAQGLTQSQLIWPGDRHVFGSVAKVKALRASDQSTVCWYFNHFSNFRAFPFSEENGNGMQCSSNQDWDENWLTVGVWTHSSPRFHLCLAKPSDECGTQGTLFSRAVVQRP